MAATASDEDVKVTDTVHENDKQNGRQSGTGEKTEDTSNGSDKHQNGKLHHDEKNRNSDHAEVTFAPSRDSNLSNRNVKRSKYHETLQVLKPVRPKQDPSKFPSSQAGLFSFIGLTFLTPVIWKIFKTSKLDIEDLWPCPPEEACKRNTDRAERLWKEELAKNGKRASVARVFVKFIRTRYFVNFIFLFGMCMASFVGPTFLLRGILDYTTEESTLELWQGLMYVLGLLIFDFLRAICFTVMWINNSHTGTRARTAMIGLLYKKILRLRSLKSKAVGEFVNICANDSNRLFEAVCLSQLLWGAPVVIIAGVIYCFFIFGPWILVGVFVFAIYIPFQVVVSKITLKLRRKSIKVTDKRVQMMSEILTCIKLIKLYAWEIPFSKSLADVREKERSILEKAAYLQTMSSAFSPMMPVFAAVATFFCHTVAGNPLSATQAFVVLAVFLLWRNRAIGPLPFAVKAMAETLHGMTRMKDILMMEEKETVSTAVKNPKNAVEFTRAVFGWDSVGATDNEDDKEKTENKDEKPKNGGPIYIS